MLNKDESERLDTILLSLRRGGTVSGVTQMWLAVKLSELHVKAKRHYDGSKSNRPIEKAVIDQAKQLMMAKYDWTEEEAHTFVRTAATNNRTTKFQVAKRFLESQTK